MSSIRQYSALFLLVLGLSEAHRFTPRDFDDYPKFRKESVSSSEGTRIVGGDIAAAGDAPYQISMRYKPRNFHFCGGSIIDTQWILTAAHCVSDFKPEEIEIVAGSLSLVEGGERYDVEKIIPHEYYNPLIIRDDIALVKVNREIAYSDGVVAAIPLCDHYVDGGVTMLLTGWGLTSFPGNVSKELKRADLMSISNPECIVRHFLEITPPVSFSKNICTLNGKDEGACKGDSGGPLVDTTTNQLCGVVSWGVPCAKGAPDVFTRVTAFSDWIEKNKV